MVKNTDCREQSGGRRFKMEETRAWWIVLKSYLSSSDILRDIFLVKKKRRKREGQRREGGALGFAARLQVWRHCYVLNMNINSDMVCYFHLKICAF